MFKIILGIFGAIIAAVLTAFLTPYFEKMIEPKEGLFYVKINHVSKKDIPVILQDQIKNFPCEIIIKWVYGPSIKDLKICIKSNRILKELKAIRNDENIVPIGLDNNKYFVFNIPYLRKGSVIHFKFISIGEPILEKYIINGTGTELVKYSN